MKIAFFVHGYLPWDVYGVPRYIEALAHQMAKKGHKIVILCVGRQGLRKVEEISNNLKIYRSNYINPPRFLVFVSGLWSLLLYTLWCIIKGPEIIRKEEIDIIHGHTFEWGGIQALIVSIMTQRPCIITIHGVGLARNRIEEKAQKALLRFCDLIICQRKTVLEKMISWGYKQDKVRMLEGGAIDTKKYKPRTTKYINHHLKITFVGRLDDFRGPELLLDAIPIVIRSYSDTIFQFVGDGPKKIYLIKKAKKMNIEKYVRFLGTRNDVNNILENSDIYVAVSPYENLSSLALFEAMSTGLAIVATDVGETKNLVQKKETLLLAKPTPNSIAEQLLRLLYDQKLRLTLGKNARELIIEEYSLDKLVASHEKVYMNVLQSRYLSPMRERN